MTDTPYAARAPFEEALQQNPDDEVTRGICGDFFAEQGDRLREVAARTGRRTEDVLNTWKTRAMALARDWARGNPVLWKSKFATVLYGRGGQDSVGYGVYSKKWHRSYGPARWKNAGCRLDDEHAPTCVILYTYRGKEAARIPWTESGGEA